MRIFVIWNGGFTGGAARGCDVSTGRWRGVKNGGNRQNGYKIFGAN